MEPGHLLHSALTCLPSGNSRHLKSRHPFVLAAQQLISTSDDTSRSAVLCADHRWNAESWRALQDSVLSSPPRPPGMAQPRTAIASDPMSDISLLLVQMGLWSPLRLVSVAQKIKPSNIVVFQCPIHRPPHGLHGLAVLDEETIDCSTPAPTCSAAKQWTGRTGSNDCDEATCACVL